MPHLENSFRRDDRNTTKRDSMKKKKAEQDIAELINKIQEQLVVLGEKVDVLLSKSATVHADNIPFSKPFQQVVHANNSSSDPKPNGNFKSKPMYKAVCADCKKDCEVPFKPKGDRPVYCKECFSKRKSGGAFKPASNNVPQSAFIVQPSEKEQPQQQDAKKNSGIKKKPAVKKRKSAK